MKKETPTTKHEERLVKLVRQIHAGCNLQGFMIPSEEVLRKVQKLIIKELKHWA